MSYKDELTRAMKLLASNENIIFLGQSVKYPGQTMTPTLQDVPAEKKLEMPIAEDMQMGVSIGLSLAGFIPVSLFSRFDFLILACNQLVNHLDKIELMSLGQFIPKIIVRTIVGSTKPLYPGLQHTQDYTDALKLMLKNVNVVRLECAEAIVPAYQSALDSRRSTVLIEIGDDYSEL